MRLQLVILLILAVAGVFGVRAFPFAGLSSITQFDYASATPVEREAYLESLGRNLKTEFNPNYFARKATHTSRGRALTFTYKMRSNKIDCDTDYSCDIMQCKRYLKLPVSTHNISVRIRYETSTGRTLGSQVLKNSTCNALISKWKAKQA